MKKKWVSLIVSFAFFFFSQPVQAVDGGLSLFCSQEPAQIGDKSMQAVSLIDVSKNVAEEFFSGGKSFFKGDCFISASCGSQGQSFKDYGRVIFAGAVKKERKRDA